MIVARPWRAPSCRFPWLPWRVQKFSCNRARRSPWHMSHHVLLVPVKTPKEKEWVMNGIRPKRKLVPRTRMLTPRSQTKRAAQTSQPKGHEGQTQKAGIRGSHRGAMVRTTWRLCSPSTNDRGPCLVLRSHAKEPQGLRTYPEGLNGATNAGSPVSARWHTNRPDVMSRSRGTSRTPQTSNDSSRF